MRMLRISRNADAFSADDGGEMTLFDRVDDDAMDVMASGVVPPGRDDLNDVARFGAALGDAAVASPRPSAELAALLVEGLSPTEADVVGSSVRGQSKERIRPVIETALAKLASLGIAAKASVAGAAVLAATTGAGAAGALPEPVQDTVADVVSTYSPFEVPRSDDAGAHDDGGAPDDAPAPRDVTVPDHGDPDANDHGQTVADTARTTDAEGCDRGHEIAEVAGGDPAECVDGGGDAAAAPGDRKPDAAAERAADDGGQGLEAAADGATAGQDTADHDVPADPGSQGQQPDDAGRRGSDAAADGAGNADAARP